MFASCANNSGTNSDNGNSNGTNNENPSPTLPSNVGKNPITKTIRLKTCEDSSHYLELKTDGTALDIYFEEGKSEVEDTVSKYKYTYDDEKRTITMKLEKTILDMDFEGNQEQLMTYSEICSKINEVLTVENMKKSQYERIYKAAFDAQITYAYKIENDKMTLTEKFTGVKNLIDSECSSDGKSNYAYIDCDSASVEENDIDYDGTVDTDKKTIIFKSKKGGEKVNATYTENISEGTVTIKFKDKEYLCEFEGEEYTQVE